ncbi:MAG: PIN domain-containing protein [Brevinematales bacterium]|nr:PIN domain-containing protein [Brevinematales bacterium]
MSDSLFFLDSSVIIYSIDKNPSKKESTLKLLERNPVISTQVLNEISNVMRRKFNFDYPSIFQITSKIVENSQLSLIDFKTISFAFNLAGTYSFSYYDSLIIASALENNCTILYSEDMQHQQVIEERLQIINPYL